MGYQTRPRPALSPTGNDNDSTRFANQILPNANRQPGRQTLPAAPGLNVNDLAEWQGIVALEERRAKGLSNTSIQQNYVVPKTFNFAQWLEDGGTHYSMSQANRAIIHCDDGVVMITYNRGTLYVIVHGSPEVVNRYHEQFGAEFESARNMIEWVYDSDGNSITVPLSYRPAINAAYPNIKGTVTDYIDEYLESDSSVLILIGAPGTGKTSFIKQLIHQSGSNAKIAFDAQVLNSDGFFARFMEDQSTFLIMEDADMFLSARSDGNTMMHKFLNLADGLISAKDKKLVFSTNLPNINDIDAALLRPGRCFDVLQFRTLDRVEALAVLAEVESDAELPDGSSFTLAELFNKQPSGKAKRRSFGLSL